MIFLKLQGGLGNQLFQYAAGRQLSVFFKTTLKLDLSGFKNQEKRAYALDVYKIKENFCSPSEVAQAFFPNSNQVMHLIYKFLYKIKLWHNPNFFQERSILPYRDQLYKASLPIFLNGYWQSEKYFYKITDLLHKEFSLRAEPNLQSQKIREQIQSCTAISIHVRHGDYVTEKLTSKTHGICSINYYRQAIDMIKHAVVNPHFFVFSDDILWAKENFDISSPINFIDHNGPQNAHEDLWLMSLCQHHIIANSSFSWWGAWLGKNPDKIVVAPQKWFNDPSLDTSDLIPSSWKRI